MCAIPFPRAVPRLSLLIRRGILFAQKFFAEIVDTRITNRVRVVLRQQGRFLEGNTMSSMSNIYTTAMVISELENRMNELEEECVSVNEADDEYPCLCDIHGELDAVYSQWRRMAKEWATFPVAIRNEAMQMAMEGINA